MNVFKNRERDREREKNTTTCRQRVVLTFQ